MVRGVLRVLVTVTERVAELAIALEEQVGGQPRERPTAVPTQARPGVDSIHALLAKVLDGVLVLDQDGTVNYASPDLQQMLGRHDALVGTDALQLVHPEDVGAIRGALATLRSRNAGAMVLEFRAEHGDGSWRWFEAQATNLLDDPDISGILWNMRDVSERRAHEDDLRHRALHDTLTGLPNRTLLLDRLRGAIGRTGRDGREVALFFLDLDGFKEINDTLGHGAGDDVLTGIGRRLASVARAQDTVARYGGDEFVVVVEHNQDKERVKSFTERIRSVFFEPVQAAQQAVQVSASIGIACINSGTPTPEGLLRDADTAMYRAKQAGGNSWVLFDESMIDDDYVDLTTQ
ncbi:MAG: GGDEF domain-containing protein [Actinobacteria bacterium]|nr:GGDEF domain-containing protein [Actinomycetota bacterium]